MRTLTLTVAILVASIAMSSVATAQSSSKRRSPVLTSDDLGSAREAVRLPLEASVEPPRREKPEPVPGRVSWHRDLRRAFEEATAQGQLVIVDVYTDWCGWCKKMDRSVYSSSRIAALSRQQTFVKLNAEDGGQGQHFAQQMGVKSYPTTIILDANGRVLKFARGYIGSPAAFLELVQEAQSAQAR